MTKEEFLDDLRSSLSGSVSADVINDNLKYYENFINTEIRKGRTEDDVLDELGNPRLIAKTVIDTTDSSQKRTVETDEDEQDDRIMGSRSDIMPWWMILLIIFGIMILIYLAIKVAIFLLPVIIVLIFIGIIIRLIGRNQR